MAEGYTYDPIRRRYLSPSGKVVSLDVIRALRDRWADIQADVIRGFATNVETGVWTLVEFEAATRLWLGETIGAGYQLGRGGAGMMTVDDAFELSRLISEQARKLELLIADQQTGRLSWAQFGAYAETQAGAAVHAFEVGQEKANGGLDLPAYPADGSTSCVADPQARVLTAVGWIPISDVVVGDLVMTHRGRLKPVTAVIRTPANGRRFVDVAVANHRPVRFTTDHELLSPIGWYPVDGIMNRELPVYIISRATNERYMRAVRQAMRSPRDAVYQLRQRDQGEGAMAGSGDSRGHAGQHPGGGEKAPQDIRGSVLGNEVAATQRWPLLHVVLGRRPKADHLPIPVGLDQGERSDSTGTSYPPYQRGQVGRPNRELAGSVASISWQASHESPKSGNAESAWRGANRTEERHVRDVRRNVSHQDPRQSESVLFSTVSHSFDADDPQLRGLRKRVHWWIGAWEAPALLQSGMLPDGTTLYDLTVADDHSFVVESIVAHNCTWNCRCYWEIEDIGDAWECYWITVGDERVCPECEQRGYEWSPYVQTK